jgi:hypothetical protein
MVIGVSLVSMDRICSSLPSAGTEDDGERNEAAQDEAVAVRPGQGVAVGELQARVTAEQGFEGDSGFEPGEGSAKAVMDPVAEPEVGSVAAADVQDVGR